MEPMLKTETENQNKKWYMRGLRDGIPIGLGYFAVGFTLGIAAREAGITAFQMGLMSLLMHGLRQSPLSQATQVLWPWC